MRRSSVVLANGSRIAIQRSGRQRDKTAILLHHGTGCIQSWDNVVRVKSRRRSIRSLTIEE